MVGMPAVPVEAWEWMWAPYDAATYQTVLSQVVASDTVLEIGAGDLRLSRMLAECASHIYALEINTTLLEQSSQETVPANLAVITGDARLVPFPQDVTVAVLLMRHCTHFQLYFEKLQAIHCRRLITNARWGMGVETIDLAAAAHTFEEIGMGWYACRCGGRGFRPGPPSQLTEAAASTIWEVSACPSCTRTPAHAQEAAKHAALSVR